MVVKRFYQNFKIYEREYIRPRYRLAAGKPRRSFSDGRVYGDIEDQI
jgi:hypothetical protein